MSTKDGSERRRIDELEARLQAAERELRATRFEVATAFAARERWLAQVVGVSTSSPPGDSDTAYRCLLLSCTFNDAAPGVVAAVTAQRGSECVALSWPVRSHGVGDYVIVERIRTATVADTVAGEWFITCDRAEVRWGRTTVYAYSYPDLSRAGTSMGTIHPVYEIELGRMPLPTVASGLGEWFGHVALVPATAEINPVFSRFVADSPRVVVEALSLIGELHKGQPALLVLEAGRWYIIGPSIAGVSRETMRFSSYGWRYSDNAYVNPVTGTDRLNVQRAEMLGTGGDGGAAAPYDFHDIKPLDQTGFADPAFEVMRRGDYEISLFLNPLVYQYGYLQTGVFNANEFTALAASTGYLYMQGVAGGGGGTVDIYTASGGIYWRGLVTLEWVDGLAPAETVKMQWRPMFNYLQTPQPIWPATQVASLNKGDKLRLVFENDPTEFAPAGLLNRGWRSAESVYLGIRRLPDGLTNIP